MVKKHVLAAFIGNLGIALAKLFAAIATASLSMLAESLHSFSDTFNQVLLMVGIRRSAKPPDLARPFGYGKAQFFWSFVVALLLFFVSGAFSLLRGYGGLGGHIVPHGSINFLVLGIAAVFESGALIVALQAANKERKAKGYSGLLETLKETKDPTILTVVMEDLAALLGIFIAAGSLFLAQTTSNPVYDAYGSMLIGILLMAFALFLANETRSLLLGEPLSDEDLAILHNILADTTEIEEVISVRTTYLSPDEALIGLNIRFNEDLSGEEIEASIDRLEAALVQKIPVARRVYVEPQ